MQTYVVSYDLIGRESSASYQKIIKAFDFFDAYSKLLESFWIVKTNWPLDQVYNHLNAQIDQNDKLVVVDVRNNVLMFPSNFPKEKNDWIQNHWNS